MYSLKRMSHHSALCTIKEGCAHVQIVGTVHNGNWIFFTSFETNYNIWTPKLSQLSSRQEVPFHKTWIFKLRQVTKQIP